MGSQPRFRPDRGLHFLHRTISKRVHELAAAEDYPGPALPVPHVRSNGGHLGEGAGLARTPSSMTHPYVSFTLKDRDQLDGDFNLTGRHADRTPSSARNVQRHCHSLPTDNSAK